MTSARRPPSLTFSPTVIRRAERAVRCSPFRQQLFERLQWQGIPIGAIAGAQGLRNGYLKRSLPELTVENELMWLIQTGLLRREVDGQGLTDSFRLTPLGRQLIVHWNHGKKFDNSPYWLAYLWNSVNRWIRIPWL
ncbi:MAG: Npun_F0494 family protein [Cyanobacteria bacterium P01_A01_bin.135]